MTQEGKNREKEIAQAAESEYFVTKAEEFAWIRGAEWADQHPRKGLVDIDKIASFIKYHAQEFVYISTHSGEAKINEFKLVEAMYKAMYKAMEE